MYIRLDGVKYWEMLRGKQGKIGKDIRRSDMVYYVCDMGY